MRKLWLHIGAQRTATTSIQSFLHRNFTPLLAQGILYPYGVERHKTLMDDLLSGARHPDEVAADLNARADDKPHVVSAILLSDEGVCLRRDLSRLTRLREHFDLRVIFTLRRQDRWLESWYLQNIKWQWNPELSHLTFAEFMARRDSFHWIDYNRYVTHLENVFGGENLSLIRFERAQMPGGPVAEFCRRLGLDPAQATAQGFGPARHENASYSPGMAEFMRQLPIGIGSDDLRAALTDACANVDRQLRAAGAPPAVQAISAAKANSATKGSELLLTPEARRQVMAQYAPGNQALAARYFQSQPLFEEALPAADAPLADMRLPSDSATLMRLYVAPLIAELNHLGALRRPQAHSPSLQPSEPSQ